MKSPEAQEKALVDSLNMEMEKKNGRSHLSLGMLWLTIEVPNQLLFIHLRI